MDRRITIKDRYAVVYECGFMDMNRYEWLDTEDIDGFGQVDKYGYRYEWTYEDMEGYRSIWIDMDSRYRQLQIEMPIY